MKDRTMRAPLALLLCIAALTAPTADAQTAWINYGIINKADSHTCITLMTDAGRSRPTASIGLQPCAMETAHGGQAWAWIKVDGKSRRNVDTYAFQNVVSQTCIGVATAARGQPVRLASVRCDFSDATQLWTRASQLRPGSSIAGMTKWVNLKSRKCMDLDDDGALRQWTCQWSGPYWPQEFVAP